MKGNKAFKYRIYPNDEQQILMNKTFGCCRFIYNIMLSDKQKYYKENKKTLLNTPAMYKGTYQWLKEVDSLALANVQMNLQTAYSNWFRNMKKGEKTTLRFKSKKYSRKSYTTNNSGDSIRFENGCLKLPKVGYVKIKQHRDAPSDYKLKSVTVSKSATGKYFASVLYEYESQVSDKPIKKVLGLDYSMSNLYIDSDGYCPDYPKYYRTAEKRLAREQRKLSKRYCKGKKEQSSRYYKQKYKVAKLHEKVTNQRNDFLHKQSYMLAEAYDLVAVEDLNMKGVSKALHFGKSVHDNSWGRFITMLEYKLKDRGKSLVKVDKFFPSSQTCHVCGAVNPITKDLSIRKWTCPDCGTVHDRDINAAINIKEEGLRLALL